MKESALKLTIEDMKQEAAKHNGKCLSSLYVDNRYKLKWQCKEGHIWEASPANIRSGYWCKICANESRKGIRPHTGTTKKLSLEQIKKLAREHLGELLSKEYKNATEKLEWECQSGHTFKMDVNHVKRGQWCPKCSYRERTGKAIDIKKEEKKNPEKVIVEIKNFSHKTFRISEFNDKRLEEKAKFLNVNVNDLLENIIDNYFEIEKILKKSLKN